MEIKKVWTLWVDDDEGSDPFLIGIATNQKKATEMQKRIEETFGKALMVSVEEMTMDHLKLNDKTYVF